MLYLGRQDVLHGQDVHLGVDRERRLDLRTNDEGAVDLRQLLDLAASLHDALERHIPRSAVRADIRLLVVDREHAVLDLGADEAVRLAVPSSACWTGFAGA